VLAALLSIIVQFISGSLNDLGSVARVYEANLQIYWSRFPLSDSLPADGLWQNLSDWLDISTLVTAVALTFTGFAADGILIVIYTLFLFWKQGNFESKLTALINDVEQEKRVQKIVEKVRSDIQRYIRIKILTSTATGLLSYLVLSLLEVDYPDMEGR